MASLGPTSAEITLTSNYGGSGGGSVFGAMPQATECAICRKPYADHPGEKCLFDATQFQQEAFYAFKQRFEAWSSGQRLEDCLAQIVYNLTKVK